MKKFFSESGPHYQSYTFPYGYYALMESKGDVSDIYRNGFLPLTGNVNLQYPLFYKSRSLRINLDDFSDSSENRRIAKKFSELDVVIRPVGLPIVKNKEFQEFAIQYSKRRFKMGSLSKKRLEYIVSRPYLSNVYECKDGEKLLGYILTVEGRGVFHYWFCFFNLDVAEKLPIGKFLMWKGIHLAKELGFPHIYLGTCYNSRSLYKVRDFKGVEFHDGNNWCVDMKLLKEKCKADDENKLNCIDELKAAENINQYVDSILKPEI